MERGRDVVIHAPAAIARGVAPAPAGADVDPWALIEAQAALIREKEAALDAQREANTMVAHAALAMARMLVELGYAVDGEDAPAVRVDAATYERMMGGFIRIDELQGGGIMVTAKERAR